MQNDFRQECVHWLADYLPVLQVTLDIKASAKVPGGVKATIQGVEIVLRHYRWMRDWVTTKEKLRGLIQRLQEAGAHQDNVAALRACNEIFVWGGERKSETRARRFLEGKAHAGRLVEYLEKTRGAFDLNTGSVAQLECVALMSSMLTKVHAFYARDGLPIYDSRVSAAAAALIERFRRTHRMNDRLPEDLRFPSVGGAGPARRLQYLFPDATDLTPVGYGIKAPLAWSAAQFRLGRLLRDVLRANKRLFEEEGGELDRMHALEASLFMIGYNLDSLKAK